MNSAEAQRDLAPTLCSLRQASAGIDALKKQSLRLLIRLLDTVQLRYRVCAIVSRLREMNACVTIQFVNFACNHTGTN